MVLAGRRDYFLANVVASIRILKSGYKLKMLIFLNK